TGIDDTNGKRLERSLKSREIHVADGGQRHARLGESSRRRVRVDIVDRPQRRLAVAEPVSAFAEVALPLELRQCVVNRGGIDLSAQMTYEFVRGTAVDQRRHELVKPAP